MLLRLFALNFRGQKIQSKILIWSMSIFIAGIRFLMRSLPLVIGGRATAGMHPADSYHLKKHIEYPWKEMGRIYERRKRHEDLDSRQREACKASDWNDDKPPNATEGKCQTLQENDDGEVFVFRIHPGKDPAYLARHKCVSCNPVKKVAAGIRGGGEPLTYR